METTAYAPRIDTTDIDREFQEIVAGLEQHRDDPEAVASRQRYSLDMPGLVGPLREQIAELLDVTQKQDQNTSTHYTDNLEDLQSFRRNGELPSELKNLKEFRRNNLYSFVGEHNDLPLYSEQSSDEYFEYRQRVTIGQQALHNVVMPAAAEVQEQPSRFRRAGRLIGKMLRFSR